ncbi:zinc-binding protein A33-like [Pristis pectinata]|uniref:zinc-binding protein A33-like n=1 Tax=Pristis pectinata TaxID=685728 RepID=UPI00223E654C|nr:zinc-binding protein A33-like [Pristis pectinata]
MAAKEQVASLNEEVTCQICRDFFTDPVILECGHNFCRRCITRRWEREVKNSCPECNAEFAGRALKVNPALGSLALKTQGLNLMLKEKERKLQCEEHQEELKMFCETDKKLICVICATSREHKSHNFMPIKEAVEIYKNHVKSSLESLAKKKSEVHEMAEQQKQKISGVREQSQSLQAHVKSLFDDLRQILAEREERLLRELRAEEEKTLNPMEKNLRDIQENLSSIQQKLSKLQEQIDQQDSATFLKEESCQKRSFSTEEHVFSILDGALPVKTFSHATLLKAVLSEEFNFIKQVSVTLDVETAASRLEVSEDRKNVRWTRTSKDLPDTGKRFEDQPCALGSEGFTSGRHYWEVEVAGSRRWSLGVAAESVARKGLVRLRPATGVWSIARNNDKFFANSSLSSPLPAGTIPERVRVYLSYESGTVSFYSVDTKSHLYTFPVTKFTGKLYPFFRAVDGNWLRISSGSFPLL